MDETTRLEITDVAFGGDGVGHIDGMAIFVRGGIPGDIVQIAYEQKKKRFARGRLISVLSPSTNRREAVCPLSNVCPGCAYQHVAYEQEVTWKKAQLEGLLRRIGGFAHLPSFEAVASPRELHYRNKLVLHADGQGMLGYYGADNRSLLDVEECPLAVAPIGEALRAFRAEQGSSLCAKENVTFRWTELDGVVSWRNKKVPSGMLTEQVCGRQWKIPADVFWQTNPYAVDFLAKSVVDMAQGCDAKNLIDLYCGSGLFSLLLASEMEHVLGIEMEAGAVQAAEDNAGRAGIRNVMFWSGDAGRKLSAALAHVKARETLVVVDPPRSGLAPHVRDALLREGRQPRYLLYVSCAADTLARDLKGLGGGGYAIRDLQLVDMFPRTAHFETVVMLERA